MLVGHDGPCARLHGHSYKVEVTFGGRLLEGGPKDGMVKDFGDITAFWRENLEPRLDHKFLIAEKQYADWYAFSAASAMFKDMVETRSFSLLPVARTTAENIANWLLQEFKAMDYTTEVPAAIPGSENHVTKVTQVVVWETETGCARAVRS